MQTSIYYETDIKVHHLAKINIINIEKKHISPGWISWSRGQEYKQTYFLERWDYYKISERKWNGSPLLTWMWCSPRQRLTGNPWFRRKYTMRPIFRSASFSFWVACPTAWSASHTCNCARRVESLDCFWCSSASRSSCLASSSVQAPLNSGI